mmetsp:Transcript_25789/g.36463  ORF Transcript_25789/g.36463 Transcript_25789/m.36463 type:complete len:283 (-) Transcript_25789:505-1353(-)
MQVAYQVCENSFGKGLFVKHDIKAGCKLWDFHKSKSVVYDEAQARHWIDTQDDAIKRDITEHSFWVTRRQVIGQQGGNDPNPNGLCLVDVRQDDGRFFNHSATPNCTMGSLLNERQRVTDFDPMSIYACRNIRSHEELSDDSCAFSQDPHWYSNVCKRLGVNRSFMELMPSNLLGMPGELSGLSMPPVMMYPPVPPPPTEPEGPVILGLTMTTESAGDDIRDQRQRIENRTWKPNPKKHFDWIAVVNSKKTQSCSASSDLSDQAGRCADSRESCRVAARAQG